MQIQPYETNHLDAVIQLSLRAWASVFDSIQSAMNPDVYQAFYPDGWRVGSTDGDERLCFLRVIFFSRDANLDAVTEAIQNVQQTIYREA